MNTDKQQIEYSKEAKVLAAQYRAIGNPAFSMGKLCTICGGPVLNVSKVLTCQDCRNDQHLSSASVASDSPNITTRHAKIKPEHYAYMLSEIRKIATPDIIAIHRRYLTNENKAKDVEKRLRWDFAYSAKLTPFICDTLYSYANDTHIDTALRSIIKTCEASHLGTAAI